jgi:hypothetical protein
MNFKNWLLLSEGSIKIPYKVIQPIVNDYFDYYKDVNLGKSNLRDKKKEYILDLSDTNYNFPNIIPKLKVTYKGIKDKTIIGGFTPSKTKIEYPPQIQLPYNPTITVIGDIILKKDLPSNESPFKLIEHEVIHFIQDLININMSHNKGIYKNSGKRPDFGGSGPRKLTQDLMNKLNVDFDGNNKFHGRKIDHEKIATEYQTNLSSIIILLYQEFTSTFLSGNLNPDYYSYPYDIIKNIKTKEDFEKNKDVIIEFLNNQTAKKKFIKKIDINKLTKIKNFNKELYNWYLNEIYKNFVIKDIEEYKLNQIVDEYFFVKNKSSNEDKYFANNITLRNFIKLFKNTDSNSYTINHSNFLQEIPTSKIIENVNSSYLFDFAKRIIDKFYQVKTNDIDLKDYRYGQEVSKKTINRNDLKTIFNFIKKLKEKSNTYAPERFIGLEELSNELATFLAEDIAWSYGQHYRNKKIDKTPPTADDILKDFYEL